MNPVSLLPHLVQTDNTVLYVTLGLPVRILANSSISVFSMGVALPDMCTRFLSLLSESLLEPKVNSSFYYVLLAVFLYR